MTSRMASTATDGNERLQKQANTGGEVGPILFSRVSMQCMQQSAIMFYQFCRLSVRLSVRL